MPSVVGPGDGAATSGVSLNNSGLGLENDSSMDMADSLRKIACPYCEYEKQEPADRLPAKPVGATCPRCGSRFMFKPPVDSLGREKRRDTKTKYRGDYDIIKEEFVADYARLFSSQKNNLALIASVFIIYCLMYFIITAVLYLNMKTKGLHVGNLVEYLEVVCVFAFFYPAMIMHSWKFIDRSSQSLLEQLYSYKGVLIVVALVYSMLLLITAHFLGSDEMPLVLIAPVIASSLIPTLLHVSVDSL